MSYRETTICGVVYCTDDALAVGDYFGSAAVGESNLRVLSAEFDEQYPDDDAESISLRKWNEWCEGRTPATLSRVPIEGREWWTWPSEWRDDEPPTAVLVEVSGDFGYRQAWVRRDHELADLVDSLSSYPALSDDDLCEVESDAESDAFADWIRADLRKYIDDDIDDDDIDDDDAYRLYRQAMETCNEYPVHETSGCYVNVDRIGPTYAALVRDHIDA